MNRRVKPTVSSVLAVIAVVLSLGGTAVASSLITGKQIKNHSITAKDLASSARRPGPQGPRGATGPLGSTGPQGVQGPTGSVGATSIVLGPKVSLGPSGAATNVENSHAACPDGTGAISGGYVTGVREIISTATVDGNGYTVIAINNGPLTETLQANAICAVGASTPTGTPYTTRSARESAVARVQQQYDAAAG